eukprot:UN00570
MQSICNKLLYDLNSGRPIDQVHFIWAVRDKEMVSLCNLYHKETEREILPQESPRSFQPDLLAEHKVKLLV